MAGDRDRVTVVTTRPGAGWWLIGTLGVMLALAAVLLMPRVEQLRNEWDEAAPVLLVVRESPAVGQVELFAPERTSVWTVDIGKVKRVGSAAPGTQHIGRAVGECDCELLLEPPGRLPGLLPVASVLCLVGAVALFMARRRWHGLPELLASPGRPVQVEPIWMRRSFGVARLGVRATEDATSAIYLELDRTPVAWLPADGRVLFHPPARTGGISALANSDGEIAVASGAPLGGERGARRVASWSRHLAITMGLVPPATDRSVPAAVGGDQRIHITPQVASAALEPVAMGAARRRGAILMAILIAAMLVIRPTPLVFALVWAAFIGGFQILAYISLAQLASRPPFDSWPDRQAARAAARAAVRLGFVPVRSAPVDRSDGTAPPGDGTDRASTWQAGPDGRPADLGGVAFTDGFDRPAP